MNPDIQRATPEADAGPPPQANACDTLEDTTLALRARTGDAGAFAALVERYAPRVHALAWRLLRDPLDAEELVQESFLRAYRYLPRWDASLPFRAWLYAIATHAGFNMLRARRRRGVEVPLEEHALVQSVEREPVDSVRHAAHRAELRVRIEAAVDRLPPRTALLVYLHYTEGLSVAEAAEATGMREGAAKTALCRARKQLREWLAGD